MPYSKSKVTQSCPTLCDPMDYSLLGFSVHGIFQARVLEWVAISFFRRSSRPRDWTPVSRIVGRCFTVWALNTTHPAIYLSVTPPSYKKVLPYGRKYPLHVLLFFFFPLFGHHATLPLKYTLKKVTGKKMSQVYLQIFPLLLTLSCPLVKLFLMHHQLHDDTLWEKRNRACKALDYKQLLNMKAW